MQFAVLGIVPMVLFSFSDIIRPEAMRAFFTDKLSLGYVSYQRLESPVNYEMSLYKNPKRYVNIDSNLQSGFADGGNILLVEAENVALLAEDFKAMDYSLPAVKSGKIDVPRISLQDVPAGFNDIPDVNAKKALFIKSMLPMVLIANENLMYHHQKLDALSQLSAQASGTSWNKGLSFYEQTWAETQFTRYKVALGDWEALKMRVGAVPVSLALAQAAIESGWGGSRFAQQGNALFGQWIWGNDNAGIVPEARSDDQTHSIRKFETPYDAIAAYMHNLNTHPAYEDFRIARLNFYESQHDHITGDQAFQSVLMGLDSYSEKGLEYIDLLNIVINQNSLKTLESAKLESAAANLFSAFYRNNFLRNNS
ncbi:MAG: glucosaminidase domain-containing protein [Alphaproteobacteria bacterium]